MELPPNEELGKMGEDELIVTLIPVAKLIGRYSEDAQQEAILGLIEAVGRLGTIQHGGIKEYLCSCIKGRVRGYMEKLPLVAIPRHAFASGVSNGEGFQYIDEQVAYELGVDSFLSNYLLKDEIEVLINNIRKPLHIKILMGRMAGKSDAEIGEELGLSQQVIHFQRKKLQKRLVQLLGGRR